MIAVMPQPATPPDPLMHITGSWLEVVSHLDPKYGGLSAAVPALGRRIAQESSLSVSVAAFCALGEEFRPEGFSSRQLSFWPSSRKSWLLDSSLRENFQKQIARADGVHIHGLWEQSTAIAAQTSRGLKVPYIVSAHGMLEPWALGNKRLKKFVYSFLAERSNLAGAGCLHALTRAEARQYLRFGARCPIAIIPNGVDLPATTSPDLFHAQFPELDGKRIILFLGRLNRKKGLDLLLQAWTDLAKKWPDIHLVLAGPDTEGTQAELGRFVAEKGLQHSVLFAGMLRGSMKWSALAAASCFVLPSYSEGLSVSVLEAMGVGLPVIVTKACNMPEVEQFRAGWEIDAATGQLAAALDHLLDNSCSENREIGRRGANLIQARFQWPRIARQMAGVYHWLQGGPQPDNVEVVFP